MNFTKQFPLSIYYTYNISINLGQTHKFIKLKFRKLLLLVCLLPVYLFAQQEGSLNLFSLKDVRLLNGPFKIAEQTDLDYILKMEPDRLLAPYLREAGIEPKAESYGNWENSGLDGHIGGHYLSALAMMWASTGDQRIKDRLDYMIEELERAQEKNDKGYLGGIPGGPAMWKEIAEGNIRAGAFNLNGRWVPLYNIHKIYAGLRDAYLFGENETARDMLIKLTDWMYDLVSGLTDAQIQEMLKSEHGGLNEVFADVAVITGEDKYMDLARRFSHKAVLDPLVKHEDKLTGMHANTQIPKVIGFERISGIEGDEDMESAAKFFWETVVDHRSVSIGGNSVREHFNPVDDFSSMIYSEQGPETCNTYNMLRLTKLLFLSDPEIKYMDYFERALYNHILSSQNPGYGGFVYFTPMRPGHYRVYSQPQTSFWCCVGSGLENHSKYGEMIYAYRNSDLFVNLFIPSTLHWREKGIELIQNTNFPDEEKTELIINPSKKQTFNLLIRHPLWVERGRLQIFINGKEKKTKSVPGEYVTLWRKWKEGDRVTVHLPMHTVVEQLPDHEHYYSFVYGPVVLAAKTGEENMTGLYADDSRGGHIPAGVKYPLNELPVILSNPDKIAEKIQKVDDKSFKFTISDLSDTKFGQLELIPFFRLQESRYMIYFRSETAADFAEMQHNLVLEEARRQRLDMNTLDLVLPGEQQPESDHSVKFRESWTGTFRDLHWREARGWFSYKLLDKEAKAQKIQITCHKSDRIGKFRLEVNGEFIESVMINDEKTDEMYTLDFPIAGKVIHPENGILEVKFIAEDGYTTGRIYEVRILTN